MRGILRLGMIVLLWMMPLWANADERVVLGMSQDEVAISASFDGSRILIFGAVKREVPIPSDALNVVITVAGPSAPVMVRKKERYWGIWVNRDSVLVDAAPSFYAIATSDDWTTTIKDTEDLRHKISIPRAIRSVGAPMSVSNAQDFTEAIIRIRTESGHFALKENTVRLDQETLFQTEIEMPANLTEGIYDTRIFLTREGNVVDLFETSIVVKKVGLERFLYNLAQDKPFHYGILSLIIAMIAGWSASAFFAMIRNS